MNNFEGNVGPHAPSDTEHGSLSNCGQSMTWSLRLNLRRVLALRAGLLHAGAVLLGPCTGGRGERRERAGIADCGLVRGVSGGLRSRALG